jgi:hypothetical protein
MENENKKIAERTIIRTTFPDAIATRMLHYAKANPGYGVRVHLRDSQDGATKVEFHTRMCTKGTAQSRTIHFVHDFAARSNG